MSPFGQKLAWTVLAMLCILGGALVHDTTAKVSFFSLAAGITSAVWIGRPGDVPIKMIAEVARASIAPGSIPPVVKP